MQSELILSAARVLLPRAVWIAPGAIHIRAGRIAAVGAPQVLQALAAKAERVDLPGHALLPGLVNAHAHLELTSLAGRIPPSRDFGAWVREVVRLRSQQSPEELERSALLGARLCLEGGATTVGDLDATGAAERALLACSDSAVPRVLLYRELLDARTPERTQRELARVAAPAPERLRVGFAPHAPHTVSSELLRAVARAAKARGIPVAIHWAETEEEGDWLESGAGPFAALLGVSPQRSGLELLDEAGLLGPSLALVHGNRARPAEIARVARSGATLIHCPGTHAFFGREPFDLEAWRAAGVAVALGSDSMASNSALDMRLELSRLRASHPALDSRAAWDAATVHGARALGMAGLVGQLEAGAHADLLVVPAPEADGERCFERLSHGDFELRHLWLAGRAVSDSDRGLPARKSAAGCAPGECNPG